MVYHCMKKKNIFSNDVNCYIYCWLAMEPWFDVVVEVPFARECITQDLTTTAVNILAP